MTVALGSTRVVLTLLVALSLTLSACTGSPAEPGSSAGTPGSGPAVPVAEMNSRDRAGLTAGGTLTLPITDLPRTWNRFHHAGADAEAVAVQNATDPVLFDYDPVGQVRARPEFLTGLPQAAERGGRLVVTYRLNPEAVWNDGTPLDWSAFEATWRVHARREAGYQVATSAGYEDIESIAAGAGPSEVVVTFARGRKFHPVTDLFPVLLHPHAAASPAVFNEQFPVGDFRPQWRAGPFTLDRLDTTAGTISLVPNPRWWGDPPLLHRLTYQRIDPGPALPAFVNNQLDAVLVGNRDRLAQVERQPDVEIRRGRRLQIVGLYLNTETAPLDDAAVRKAIWQAVDRDEWARVRYAGLDWHDPAPGSAMHFPFQPGYEDNLPVTFSTAGARQTLEAGGYAVGPDGYYAKAGVPLAVRYTEFGDDPVGQALAQTLQAQLRKAGIRLDLDFRPPDIRIETIQRRDFAMMTLASNPSSPSPVAGMCQFMCTAGAVNISGAGTPELDARLREVGRIADPQAQTAEINAIEKEWLSLFGRLPLAGGLDVVATRPDLANWGPGAFASIYPDWSDVGWERPRGR